MEKDLRVSFVRTPNYVERDKSFYYCTLNFKEGIYDKSKPIVSENSFIDAGLEMIKHIKSKYGSSCKFEVGEKKMDTAEFKILLRKGLDSKLIGN